MNRDIYQRVKPSTVSQKIVQQIKQLIKDGKLKPGEQLPPERAFAELLGVGRPSLRQALNTLETLGFLEIRKRQGVFVKNVTSVIVADPLRLILKEDKRVLPQLYEIRKDVELSAAFLAASRRTEADLVAIETPILRMESDAQHGSFTIADDLSVHLSIAGATHNFLRVHLLQYIFDLSSDILSSVLDGLSEDPAHMPLLCRHHRQVFEAIAAGDPDRARATMQTHLAWVEQHWLQLIEDQG